MHFHPNDKLTKIRMDITLQTISCNIAFKKMNIQVFRFRELSRVTVSTALYLSVWAYQPTFQLLFSMYILCRMIYPTTIALLAFTSNANIGNLNAKLAAFHGVLFWKSVGNNCERDKADVVQCEILLGRVAAISFARRKLSFCAARRPEWLKFLGDYRATRL